MMTLSSDSLTAATWSCQSRQDDCRIRIGAGHGPGCLAASARSAPPPPVHKDALLWMQHHTGEARRLVTDSLGIRDAEPSPRSASHSRTPGVRRGPYVRPCKKCQKGVRWLLSLLAPCWVRVLGKPHPFSVLHSVLAFIVLFGLASFWSFDLAKLMRFVFMVTADFSVPWH